MIRASFVIREDVCSFELKGHSGYASSGSDIVCAAVSSAALTVANTATEIFGIDAVAEADDGCIYFAAKGDDPIAVGLVRGLLLQLSEIRKDYPRFIKISTEE